MCVGTSWTLLQLAGAEVSADPESPDFLKARFGDTRYDLTFGNGQYLRLGFRLAAGFGRNATGEGNEQGQNPAEVLGTFFRGKLSPTASLAVDWAAGKDFTGNKFQPLPDKNEDGELKPGAVGERLIPLVAQEFGEAFAEEGLGGVAKHVPSFFGVGVSSYEKRDGKPINPFAPPKLPELPKLPTLPK